jgi:hypothetical protein
LAATLSLRLLENCDFMESVRNEDYNDNVRWGYRVTAGGVDWLLSNQDRFQLNRQPSQPLRKTSLLENIGPMGISDDDVPF